VFSQDSETGNVYWQGGNDNLILWPAAIYQAPATEGPGIGINPDARLTFTTENGRQIILHPGIENPAALQTALIEWGLVRFEMGSDGNLSISGDPQFKIRPDLFSRITDSTLPLGLEWRASSLLSGLNELVFRFQDQTGAHREQVFYPVSAHPEELETALQDQLESEAIAFHHNGSLSIKIGTRTHSGVFDYTITPGTAGTETQLLPIPDKNGDSTEDFQITYRNGDQQILYRIPTPTVSEEIQGIPAVQTAGYSVSEDSNGAIRIEQGDKRIVMSSTEVIQLESSQAPGMIINPDGSGEFITENGLKIITQPQMQDLAGLESDQRQLNPNRDRQPKFQPTPRYRIKPRLGRYGIRFTQPTHHTAGRIDIHVRLQRRKRQPTPTKPLSSSPLPAKAVQLLCRTTWHRKRCF